MVNQRVHGHSDGSLVVEKPIVKVLLLIALMRPHALPSAPLVSNTEKLIVLIVKLFIEVNRGY